VDLKAEISEIINRLDASKEILQQSERLRHSDKALLERGLEELAEGKLSAAENTQAALSRLDWTDFDAALITKALQSQFDTMLKEIRALGAGKAKEALRMTLSYIESHEGSSLIRNGLNSQKIKLSKEIALGEEKRRSKFISLFVGVILIAFLIGAAYLLLNKYFELN
jgi:hypothetical protein